MACEASSTTKFPKIAFKEGQILFATTQQKNLLINMFFPKKFLSFIHQRTDSRWPHSTLNHGTPRIQGFVFILSPVFIFGWVSFLFSLSPSVFLLSLIFYSNHLYFICKKAANYSCFNIYTCDTHPLLFSEQINVTSLHYQVHDKLYKTFSYGEEKPQNMHSSFSNHALKIIMPLAPSIEMVQYIKWSYDPHYVNQWYVIKSQIHQTTNALFWKKILEHFRE